MVSPILMDSKFVNHQLEGSKYSRGPGSSNVKNHLANKSKDINSSSDKPNARKDKHMKTSLYSKYEKPHVPLHSTGKGLEKKILKFVVVPCRIIHHWDLKKQKRFA